MNVLAIVLLQDFKKQYNLNRIEIVRSAAGKMYFTVEGERIGVPDSTDLTKPLCVVTVERDGEEWSFLGNAAPREVVATI